MSPWRPVRISRAAAAAVGMAHRLAGFAAAFQRRLSNPLWSDWQPFALASALMVTLLGRNGCTMTRNMASMRRQHDALTEILLRLVNMVDRYRGGPDAYPIAVQLARLVSLLRSHLASEDEWLYPAMVAAHEPGAAALAFGFRAEMGGLASKLEEFERRWSS